MVRQCLWSISERSWNWGPERACSTADGSSNRCNTAQQWGESEKQILCLVLLYGRNTNSVGKALTACHKLVIVIKVIFNWCLFQSNNRLLSVDVLQLLTRYQLGRFLKYTLQRERVHDNVLKWNWPFNVKYTHPWGRSVWICGQRSKAYWDIQLWGHCDEKDSHWQDQLSP